MKYGMQGRGQQSKRTYRIRGRLCQQLFQQRIKSVESELQGLNTGSWEREQEMEGLGRGGKGHLPRIKMCCMYQLSTVIAIVIY